MDGNVTADQELPIWLAHPWQGKIPTHVEIRRGKVVFGDGEAELMAVCDKASGYEVDVGFSSGALTHPNLYFDRVIKPMLKALAKFADRTAA